MKFAKIITSIFLCLSFTSMLIGQGRDTGAIRGMVKDEEGNPLPGVAMNASSPSLMGTSGTTTNTDGVFRIPMLPVGEYTLVAELQGFQTVRRENIVVSLGLTVTVNLTMPAATIEEAITVYGAAPLVDVTASKVAQIIKSETLQELPINRRLDNVIGLAAGVLPKYLSPLLSELQIKGGTVANTIFQVDGLNANDPDNSLMGTDIDFNAMDELEIVTGGAPAEVGMSTGGFVNVVTKSGGNRFSGMFQAYYDSEDFSTLAIPAEQLSAYGLGEPAVNKFNYDFSGSIGGPIIKDKLWFFANGRYWNSKRGSGFKPWVDPLGVYHGEWDIEEHQQGGFLKLSFVPSQSIKIMLNANTRQYYINCRDGGLFVPHESTTMRYPWGNHTATGVLTWIANPNTIFELRGGWLDIPIDLPYVKPEMTDVPYYRDVYTGYLFGAGSRPNEWVDRPSLQLSAHMTRFQDNTLGGDHEIKAGVEVQTGGSTWANWKNDPLYFQWYDGNPYYYRGLYGLSEPHPLYGDGYIGLRNYGTTKEGSSIKADWIRTGVYLQDSMTIKNRLTINFGIRFDHTSGRIPDIYKDTSGGIAEAVGAAVFLPTYGFNPFSELDQPGVDNIMEWNIFAPRLGMSYDLFGDGKTAVKFSVGRYSDWLHASLLYGTHPLRPQTFYFRWWDNNNNQYPDAPPIDYYEDTGSLSPAIMQPEYWMQGVSEDIKAPYDDQISLGIDHELLPNFKVGLSYMYKKKTNIIDDVPMDLATGEIWYQPDSGYWVPFTTTVPAAENFPAATVNMYFKSKDAPPYFRTLANVPEAYRKYSGIDFTFDKRMANGWQLGGSVTWSKVWGNHQGDYWYIHGGAATANDANWFVNYEGRLSGDRPLILKVFGSFNIPFGFTASFFYQMHSGTPWARSVTVYPPADWAAANNVDPGTPYTVNLEDPGARRLYTYQNCDFRLEKTFSFSSFGALGVYVEIFNLLGHTFVDVNENPGGTWLPEDNNTDQGTYNLSGTYRKITGITNLSRVFRFSIRYSF